MTLNEFAHDLSAIKHEARLLFGAYWMNKLIAMIQSNDPVKYLKEERDEQ